MGKILYYRKYNLKETLIKYKCKTINELEEKLAEELRERYKTEIINIYINNNIMVIKVEDGTFM